MKNNNFHKAYALCAKVFCVTFFKKSNEIFKHKLTFKENKLMKKVGIIMGSDSDLPVVEKAINTLKSFDVPYEVHVYSAHRTPIEARDFSVNARENGFGAIIAAAGKAAHLAGAIAANTTLPVIGIPIKSSTLDGLDALLSTVQMPSGIPVATVAIDGAENAALLAMQIIAVEDKLLAKKLDDARKAASEKVLAKNKEIEVKY
jgi:5-(carboxyamino)imidazole ribonucleotide mutase